MFRWVYLKTTSVINVLSTSCGLPLLHISQGGFAKGEESPQHPFPFAFHPLVTSHLCSSVCVAVVKNPDQRQQGVCGAGIAGRGLFGLQFVIVLFVWKSRKKFKTSLPRVKSRQMEKYQAPRACSVSPVIREWDVKSWDNAAVPLKGRNLWKD